MNERRTWYLPFAPTGKPKFAVRISRGLVTHWRGHPLETWEQANECRQAIRDLLLEEGEIEEVVLHA